MIEAKSLDKKPFRIFYMEEPYFVINILTSWITLGELAGKKTRRDLIEISGTK